MTTIHRPARLATRAASFRYGGRHHSGIPGGIIPLYPGGFVGIGSLDAWRHAAACLPLGRDEKLFLETVGESSFAPETRVIGNPRDRRTGVYHIRPFGWPVIECFVGDEAARMVEETGPSAGFAQAADELADLFGSSVRRSMHPLVASNWGRMTFVGGAYSHALPGHAKARKHLALPFEQRLFFAGEATHTDDFSTAHGAYDSGFRAAEEAIAALGSPTDLRRRSDQP